MSYPPTSTRSATCVPRSHMLHADEKRQKHSGMTHAAHTATSRGTARRGEGSAGSHYHRILTKTLQNLHPVLKPYAITWGTVKNRKPLLLCHPNAAKLYLNRRNLLIQREQREMKLRNIIYGPLLRNRNTDENTTNLHVFCLPIRVHLILCSCARFLLEKGQPIRGPKSEVCLVCGNFTNFLSSPGRDKRAGTYLEFYSENLMQHCFEGRTTGRKKNTTAK